MKDQIVQAGVKAISTQMASQSCTLHKVAELFRPLPENCLLCANQICLHDVPYRKWTHSLCVFPAFLQNTGSSSFLSTSFLKENQDCSHRFQRIHSRTIPFFELGILSLSEPSGQQLA